MKKNLLFIFALFLPIYVAMGETIDVNDLRYQLNDDGSATLTSCLSTDKSSITIPSSVSDGSRSYTVKRIGDYAFDQHKEVTSVSFPNTLEYMGYCSFRYCYGLTSVTIPASLKEFSSSNFSECINLTSVTIASGSKLTKVDEAAFYNCNKLPSISLPSTVKEIGRSAFHNCTSFTSFSIPSSVETIREYAFDSCKGLTSITIPSTVTSIGEYAFWNCTSLATAVLPNGLTTISRNLFNGCSKLESVNIPSSVTKIEPGAFNYCKSLTSITFPANLTEIGYDAFNQCESLTSITFPSKVTTIGNNAFANCIGLTTITIPSTVTSIGQYSFSYCTNLTSATLPNGLTSVPRYIFTYCTNLQTVNIPSSVTVIEDGAFNRCSSLSNIVLPSNLTRIGGSAFSQTAIEQINIPSSVNAIDAHAFESCQQLVSISIPNSIEVIKNSTFRSCTSLKSFTFPSQLTTIEPYAFYSCGLEGAIIIPNTVTSIQNNAFSNCDKMTAFTCPPNLTELKDNVVSACDLLETFVFPKNLKVVPYGICESCKNLKNITFPEDVETISTYAFYGCNSITTMTLPSTVKTINSYAFYNSGVTHIVLPEGLQEIKEYAFENCTNLQEVIIPSSVTKIERGAFSGCTHIYEITFPSDASNLTLGKSIFSYNTNLKTVRFPQSGLTSIPDRMFNECDCLRNIELPSTLTTIGQYVFSGCDSLQTLYIPDGVTEIQYNAFKNCKKLKYLRLPNTLQTLGDECLSYCESLQFLNIPASVTYVGNWSVHTTATSSNTNFKSMGVLATTMPSTKDHVFWQYQPEFSLLVPSGQENDYQNSSSWTPDVQDHRTIIGYPSTKQTLTQDKIHLSVLETETYIQGGPESVYVDWFEGMGNYRVYYTDSKGNKTTNMPTESGSYKISLAFEEGPYYKAATFNNIATFEIKEIADEDFALLWDFYNQTYDWSGQKTTWSGGHNWKLIEGRKESAVGIYGVKWNNGHVEEINFGRGTSIYNLNANETPLSLFSLPQVKKIELVNVGLYGNISEKVEAYLASGKTLSPTLEHLDLYNNKLEGNITTLVNALPGLKYLDASYNKFSALYPALPETLESVNISNQNITDVVATVDLRNMTEAGFFSTLPSIIFYDPATRTYAEDIKINVQSQTNWATFDLSYQGDNDFTVTGSPTWKGASGDIAKCSYRDASNKTTNFNAYFFYDMGDVNFNGEVDVLDLQQSINYALKDGYGGYSRYNFTAGDLNADNAINVLDIVPHVDMLLSMNKPTTIEAKSRGEEDASEVCEAKLYVKNGYLMMESMCDVAAVDLILDNADEGKISMLQNSMTSVKKSLDGNRVHIVIYSTGGKVLPAGEISLARLSEDSSVGYAKLSDEEAEVVSVSLNNANAPIATDIQSISDDDIIYDEGTSWEIHTPDGMLISKGIGKPERDMTRRGIYILTIKDEKGAVVKSFKMRGSF